MQVVRTWVWPRAVSYTHLDVYKRQTLARRGNKKVSWERLPLSPLMLPVRALSLMESIPSPGGTSYRTLHQIYLEE